jgi:mannose-1-phosphate guanylyltransferase/mannose-1-phosphate guanylyltransferase/mannose-6-phosphate isomerase
MEDLVQPVILAGGSGTRLWPISTPERPKHLLQIIGEGTMLEQTIERVRNSEIFGPPVIVGAASQADDLNQLAPGARVILEPCPRGSAAAVAFAALAASPESLLLVLPSDHRIGDSAPLLDAIRKARPIAEAGYLITFGIEPTGPETGYGYITAGDTLGDGVLEAESFVEKPPRNRAIALVDSGKAFWNSGMFLFKAGAFLDELKRHAPAIHSAAQAAMNASAIDGDRVTPAEAQLVDCPSTSIDYAVMEHSDRIAVVPVKLDWSDVGSWAAVYEIEPKDADGNVLDDRSYVIGSSGCLVKSTGPQIVVIGAERLMVIATADHVLVAPLSEAQRVREAAELLRGKSEQ